MRIFANFAKSIFGANTTASIKEVNALALQGYLDKRTVGKKKKITADDYIKMAEAGEEIHAAELEYIKAADLDSVSGSLSSAKANQIARNNKSQGEVR